ncbi:hypothetical protein [Antribacter gilvus]|uniref:hypothetical protein n=1 Tax=Antribacter gilvus TaxID=2304675 RepID=UPI000F771D1B|nr:hypothetical protein [Antribacter gilvus]
MLGVAGIGLGVASATVWRGDDTVVARAVPSGSSALVVTDPGVLDLVDADVSVRATVPDGQKVTLAIGRQVDVLGWVGKDPYDRVTGLSDWETLTVTPGGTPAEEAPADGATEGEAATDPSAEASAEASAPAAEGEGEPAEGGVAEGEATETPVTLVGPEPAGNDMWVAEATGESSVTLRWSDQPGRWVLLAAAAGDDVTPPTIELTWPRVAPTPYLWPGVLGGAFLVLLGLVVLLGARRVKRRVAASRPGRAVSSVASAARSQVSRGDGTSRRSNRENGPADPSATPGVVPAGPADDQADGGAPGERQNPFAAPPFVGEPGPVPGPQPVGAGDPGNPWGAAPSAGETSQGPLRRFRSESPAPVPAAGASAVAPGFAPASGGTDQQAYQGQGQEMPAPPLAAPPEQPLRPGIPATGLRRNRRRLTGAGTAPVVPPVAPPAPAPDAAGPDGAFGGPTPFGGPPAGPLSQAAPPPAPPAPVPAPGHAPGGFDAPGAEAASGRTLTRRELRLREQAERRAATGAMPAVPEAQGNEAAEAQEVPQEQPSGRASAWRQTWGFSGDEGGER